MLRSGLNPAEMATITELKTAAGLDKARQRCRKEKSKQYVYVVLSDTEMHGMSRRRIHMSRRQFHQVGDIFKKLKPRQLSSPEV
jgi:hypothetical protein